MGTSGICKDIKQCPEGISEISDIREDIRNIFHLLREMKDSISGFEKNIAVHDVQIKHIDEGLDKHVAFGELAAARITKLEEMKYRTQGAIWGMTKGTFLLFTGGTAAVAAAVTHLLSTIQGK